MNNFVAVHKLNFDGLSTLDLYQRVDERIEAMFAAELVNEIRDLIEKDYSPEWPPMPEIGYRECVREVNGQLSIEQAKVEMRRATRIFVRRHI